MMRPVFTKLLFFISLTFFMNYSANARRIDMGEASHNAYIAFMEKYREGLPEGTLPANEESFEKKTWPPVYYGELYGDFWLVCFYPGMRLAYDIYVWWEGDSIKTGIEERVVDP